MNALKSNHKLFVFVLLLFSILASNLVNASGIGNNIVVRLAGTATAYDGNALFEDFGLPPLDALCFDVNLIDAKTGNMIGTASDCLSGISPSISDNGTMLTGTTFFFFPGGTLVSRGLTTVQPVLHGSPDSTHITGAVPSPNDDGVVYGDGKFQNASGPVRLSGAVNLSMLDSHGQITFDCVFILDI